MNDYNVDYIDLSGDICHVWVTASNKNQAINEVKREYWDVDHVVNVRQA